MAPHDDQHRQDCYAAWLVHISLLVDSGQLNPMVERAMIGCAQPSHLDTLVCEGCCMQKHVSTTVCSAVCSRSRSRLGHMLAVAGRPATAATWLAVLQVIQGAGQCLLVPAAAFGC